MELEKLDNLKAGDFVIAKIPSKNNTTSIQEEVTIIRVGKDKLAVVVKTKENVTRTLPIFNVVSFATNENTKTAQANDVKEIGQQVREAVLEGKTPTNKTAKDLVDTIQKKDHPIMAMAKEAAAEAATEQPKEKDKYLPQDVGPGPKPSAKDLMDQVDEMATQSKADLAKIKPSSAKKDKPKKGKSAEERAKRKEVIKELLKQGLRNKEISIQVDCDPAYVSDVKKKMIAEGELEG